MAQQSFYRRGNILRPECVLIGSSPLQQVFCYRSTLLTREYRKLLLAKAAQPGILVRRRRQAHLQDEKWNQICLRPRTQADEHVCRQKILKGCWRQQWKV